MKTHIDKVQNPNSLENLSSLKLDEKTHVIVCLTEEGKGCINKLGAWCIPCENDYYNLELGTLMKLIGKTWIGRDIFKSTKIYLPEIKEPNGNGSNGVNKFSTQIMEIIDTNSLKKIGVLELDLNQNVKVDLTETGKQCLENEIKNYKPCKNGYYDFKLRTLMDIFWKYIGRSELFKDDKIYFSNAEEHGLDSPVRAAKFPAIGNSLLQILEGKL